MTMKDQPMKPATSTNLVALALCASLGALPSIVAAEDIDIFTGASAGASINPRILVVLDNTSNWARQSQQWPGGAQQGQSEASAIKTVLDGIGSNINLGLMEYVTDGTANDNGGFIRFAVKPMDTTNKADLGSRLSTIKDDINGVHEKRNSNTPYGNLMYDAYNYYAGAAAYSPSAAVNAARADAAGYSSTYSQFASPLTAENSCGKSFIIFIGNPNASGPSADSAANTAALAALGGNTTQLGLPGVTISTVVSETATTVLGNTSACYASKAQASAAYGMGYNEPDNACQLYNGVGTAGATVSDAAGATCTKFGGAATGADTATAFEFKTQCAALTQGCTLGAPIDNPNIVTVSGGTTAYLATPPAATAAGAGAAASLPCPAGALSCVYTVTAGSYAPADPGLSGIVSSNCFWDGTGGNSPPAGYTAWTSASGDFGGSACPTNYTCSYTKTGNTDANICPSHTKKAVLSQTRTPWQNYNVTLTATTPGGTCPVNTNQYKIIGANLVQKNVLTQNTTPDTGPRNADEWARFMHDKGIPVAGTTIKPSVSTYTIDVYNKQPNAVQTALLMSMAKAGGGKYFAAQNEQAIVDALAQIFSEIQAINSSFASTSLPVNATNRSQNENAVFIGMFRPDQNAAPRWFGNLKRYQLINGASGTELGDANGNNAINNETGFLTPCAISYWTHDNGAYWSGLGITPDPLGTCTLYPNVSPYSDLPDGPMVEKGGAAQIIRESNATGGAGYSVNRTVYTESSNALTPFSTTSSGLSSDLVEFIKGADVNNEKSTDPSTTRPSLHGDVIHSRPLPLNYGDALGVTVYYGANDGTFRALNASTGQERWSFVAPEFFPRLARLKDNLPLIRYPNSVAGSVTQPKDYFFDGSIGVYQNAAVNTSATRVWIYPTMRRGGRMLYGFDVSSPSAPALKWKAGCTDLIGDSGCSAGMSGIGQTWSTPAAAFIKGFSSTAPVLVVGGGYDGCEDQDSATPACGSTKGGVIYVLNADTGAVIRSFATTRAVAADVALVDTDNDGMPDYAYAADTGGNLYRVDFAAGGSALGAAAWTSHRVAYTNGGGRKFLFAPALLALQGKVYLAIGSGDREHPLQSQYPFANVTNRFYVYKDDLSAAAEGNLDALENYSGTTTCTTPQVLPGSTLNGWYMDLAPGEQVVTSALIASGMVTFSTNQPVAPAVGTCSTPLGIARGYWVNLLNASGAIGAEGNCGGTRSSRFVGGGLPPSPVLASGVPVNGKVVTVVIGAVQKDGSTSVSISPQKIRPVISSRRKRSYTYTSGN
jgi:Tfp pilus tip-associated adhesin PilY1